MNFQKKADSVFRWFTMATAAAISAVPHLSPCSNKHFFKHKIFITFSNTLNKKKRTIIINCSTSPNNNDTSSSSSSTTSSAAKIRSEVLTPFRSVRMFFYLAFIASGSLGALIATTRLISPFSIDKVEILQGLGIDLAAVSIFAFLYYRENNAKNAQISRLSREENLAKLKLRVNKNKTISVSALRGIARLVIVVGPVSFIKESFERSKPYVDQLLERGVLVVPFATDTNTDGSGNDLLLLPEENQDRNKRLWQLVPVNTWEWSRWLDEQKRLANVAPEAPVYLSLRMDGRVRGSGVGYPPWNAFVAQLPPVKGLWSGLLDGMDGRV